MALGLGELQTLSHLNQPLRAQIQLISVSADESAGLVVGLAQASEQRRLGMPRMPLVVALLRFAVGEDAAGRPVINVTSRESLREPIMEFVVEVRSADSRIVRPYALLLDPPGYGRQALTAPVVAETMAEPVAAPGKSVWVQHGEIISALGFRLRPDESVAGAQMAWALYRANPHAFINGDINNLLVGAPLTIPSREFALEVSYQRALDHVNSGGRVFAQVPPPKPVPPPVVATPAVKQVVETPDSIIAPADTEAESLAAESVGSPDMQVVGKPEDFKLRLLEPESAAAPFEPPVPDTDGRQQTEEPRPFERAMDQIRSEDDELGARLAALESVIAELQQSVAERDAELAALQDDVERQSSEPAAPPPAEPEIDYVRIAVESGMLIALGILLGWVLALRGRLRRSAVSPVPEVVTSPPVETPQVLAEDGPAIITVESAETVEQAAAPVDDDVPSPQEDDSATGDDAIAKALSEADIHLAYGQFDQAEALLTEIVEAQPQVVSHRARLLKVLHGAGNADAFLTQARSLNEVAGDEEHAVLEEVASWGRELLPEEPLFGGGADDEGDVDWTQTIISTREDMEKKTAALAEPPAIDSDHLDFELVSGDVEAADDAAEDQVSDIFDVPDETSLSPGSGTEAEAVEDVEDVIDIKPELEALEFDVSPQLDAPANEVDLESAGDSPLDALPVVDGDDEDPTVINFTTGESASEEEPDTAEAFLDVGLEFSEVDESVAEGEQSEPPSVETLELPETKESLEDELLAWEDKMLDPEPKE